MNNEIATQQEIIENPIEEIKNRRKSRQPIWKCVSAFLKIFFKKPKIINVAGELPEKAVYVANHSAMAGPVIYNLYFPKPVSPWGAYPMLGNYKSRFKYLRDVYFMQKRGMKKGIASFLASFEAVFSIFIYKGMKVLPTYPDGRLVRTIKKSIESIDSERSVIIFPEDSEDGYHEKLKAFHAGFVTLAERYNKTHDEEIPIVPVYYHKKKNKMVIGKPKYLSEFDPNMSRNEIALAFCQISNDLCADYVLTEQK